MTNSDLKRAYVIDYLATHPCIDCQENELVVLEFDHVRGTKRYSINRLITNHCSLATLVAEIEKCEVRCANCHRRKTAGTFGSYRLESLETIRGRIVIAEPKKLSIDKAQEIRDKYVRGQCGYKKLAKEYGVCRSTIVGVISGRYYK